MTAVAAHDAPRTLHHRAATRRWSPTSLVVALMVVAGAGLIAYPSMATWLSDITHADAVSGYSHAVDGRDSEELRALIDDAREYNEHLPDGPLRDPYVLNAQGGGDDMAKGRAAYDEQLSLGADLPMARLRIPEIAVDLPVYHGTEEETLALGIGHLYGSGLPVGGAGTHAVLTGHSGVPGASLFTRLDELEIGDTFTIDVAGESLAYRVDQIETVLPDEGDLLRQVHGRDYVTLLTCTPTGVNTHRLLVRGERIRGVDAASGENVVPAAPVLPGFPWGAAGVGLGGLAIAVAIGRPRGEPSSVPER